ncbi:MAG: hypothetical protein OEL19_01610 [Sulfurimonas sp.]|nr:hypothetical protein [Sulfurimonas sp.]
MIFFGHRFLASKSFYHIQSIEAIQNTPPSSTLFVVFSENNLDIIEHMKRNQLPFALSIKNITELLYASALGTSYIIVEKNLAKTSQNIAQEYLMDAKVLAFISDEEDIEELGLLGIDGVIFADAIVKINS